MAIIELELVDLGDVPVVYDSARGVIQQDPAWVARHAPGFSPNRYGPGDVFLAPGENNRLVDYHEAMSRALAIVWRATPPPPTEPPGRAVAPPAAPPREPAPGTGSRVGSDVGSSLETTLDELWALLRRPIWPGDSRSLPTGFVLGAAALGYYLFGSGRRRR